MPTYLALLRAINVGGRNPLATADFRSLLERLGFTHVKSLLQSGNFVFQSKRRSTPAALEAFLEAESAKQLHLSADCLVRSAKEWQQVVAANPFPEAAQSDPSHVIVVFLKSVPPAAAVNNLRAAISGPESVCASGKQLFVIYPAGIGRSKLTIALIEKTLGTRGTGRNWNTLLKMAALASE